MHQCEHCPESFPSIKAIKQHIANVHKEHNIKCAVDKCTLTFTRRKGLRNHLQEVHGVDIEPVNILDPMNKKGKSQPEIYHKNSD